MGAFILLRAPMGWVETACERWRKMRKGKSGSRTNKVWRVGTATILRTWRCRTKNRNRVDAALCFAAATRSGRWTIIGFFANGAMATGNLAPDSRRPGFVLIAYSRQRMAASGLNFIHMAWRD